MVSRVDTAIGSVVAAIDERGMTANTLFFFCSDNGGPTQNGADNGPLRGAKGSLYEGGVRVPALVCWPGKVPAGAIVEQPLHIVDLHATLLALAGVQKPSPQPLDGFDAWPTITGQAPSPRTEILHNDTPALSAVRVGDWKLIAHWTERRRPRRAATATEAEAEPRFELFDLANDPGETNDLSANEPERLAALRARLQFYRDAAGAPLNQSDGQPAGFKTPQRWGHPDPASLGGDKNDKNDKDQAP
jgi:arylsulfatase A-like enzyme